MVILQDPLAVALQEVIQRAEVEAKGPPQVPATRTKAARGRKRSKQHRKGICAANTASSPAAIINGEEADGGLSARRALESATLAMLIREIAPLVHGIPSSELSSALSAADATTGAARIAALLSEQLAARAPMTRIMRAWLESAGRKRQILEESGGGLTAQQVAEARGISRQAVERARREERLLAVPVGSGNWRFPAVQFGHGGVPLPGLDKVLAAFRIKDPWVRLSELLAPDPELDNRSILSVLHEEGYGAVTRAVAAAREVG
jgi:hypothetical protein